KSKVSQWFYSIADVFNRAFVYALYSRAKGVLLAQQLSSEIQSISVNEGIAEQVIRITPKPEIMMRLPHYYVSLFNRRSSIGDNFWVKRPVEENELEEVYSRYRRNGRGMIMVLSEPSAGKSALCKYFAMQKQNVHTPYHIFPPDDG